MKEEYMQMQEEMQYNLEPKESINQINNKVKKVNVEEATMVKETKQETLKRLFLENGLVKDDVHKDPRGFATIKREGIDKIVAKQNIQIAYEPIKMIREIDSETKKLKVWVVVKVIASMRTGTGEHDVRNVMTFGEASDDNLIGGGKKFPVAMAEKRGMSRAVLKICGLYAQGVKGQDEMDN